MTPLDEWSARRRDLYVTTHNTQNRQTSMPSAVFEPTISASKRLQTHALDRTAAGIEYSFSTYIFLPHSELLYIHHLRSLAHYIWRYVTRETEILVSLHYQIITPPTLQCETCSGSRCDLVERSIDHGRKNAAFINDRFAWWGLCSLHLHTPTSTSQRRFYNPWLTYSGRGATFLVFNLSL
jgi:hypothetical protein